MLQLALKAKQAQWSLRDQDTDLTRNLSSPSTSGLVRADQIADDLRRSSPDTSASSQQGRHSGQQSDLS